MLGHVLTGSISVKNTFSGGQLYVHLLHLLSFMSVCVFVVFFTIDNLVYSYGDVKIVGKIIDLCSDLISIGQSEHES